MQDENAQLDALRASLDLKPEQHSLDDVVPVFVPSEFFDGEKWNGPYVLLRAASLAVTWVILQPQNTMLYVSKTTADYWKSKKIEWQGRSMENLVRLSGDRIASHHFSRPDGTPYALVMMQDDGIGPSRLLLNGYFEEVFPEGYRVAIPERSMGVALRLDASQEEKAKLEGVVEKCFNDGTAPMSPDFFNADELLAA